MTSLELLNGLARDVNGILIKTTSQLVGLPHEVLNHKPSPSRWSILECVEHLNRYNRYYNNAFRERIAVAPATTVHEVKSTWLGRKFIAFVHPSNVKATKTLRHLNPAGSHLTTDVITEFCSHQTDLIDILSEAKVVDLNRTKIPTEIFRLLSLPLGEALQLIIVHQQRHFLQIDRLLPSQEQRSFRPVSERAK